MATDKLAEQRRAGIALSPQAEEASPAKVRISLAQIAPRLGDVEHNLGRHLELISEAKRAGAKLIMFPELSLTGYFLEDLVPEVATRLDSPLVAKLAAMADGIDILVGAVVESDDFRFYNAALYFSGKRLHFVHRKVYLPTYGLFDEARYLAAGDRMRTLAMPLGSERHSKERNGGIVICEDMWHPTVISTMARQGVDIFLCISASPARGVGKDNALGTERSYDAMTRTYAQLFTSYVVYCNRVGYEDGVAFWGGSRVVAPDGSLAFGPAGRDEQLLTMTLDIGAIRRERIANPLLRDERHSLNDSENERIRNRRPSD